VGRQEAVALECFGTIGVRFQLAWVTWQNLLIRLHFVFDLFKFALAPGFTNDFPAVRFADVCVVATADCIFALEINCGAIQICAFVFLDLIDLIDCFGDKIVN